MNMHRPSKGIRTRGSRISHAGKWPGRGIQSRTCNGFTLLELLIALSIASVLFIALYTSFFSVIKSRSGIDRQLERGREISRFLDVFTTEVNSAFIKENNLRTGFIGASGFRRGKLLSTLTFSAFGYPLLKKDSPAGDLMTVRYSVEETAPGRMSLYKEKWNPYTTDGAGQGIVKTEVIEDIGGFEVSYFNGTEWAKAWNSNLDKRLPGAVKAVIAAKDAGEGRELTITARTMIR